jgi:hypothetical protein
MLKKAGNIIIVVLLLIATGGIPFTRHYCGTTAMSFSIFSVPEPCCDNNCDKCHNVFKFSKLDSEFETSISDNIREPVSSAGFQPASFFDLLPLSQQPPSFSIFYQRAGFIDETCLSPAFLGNFRC